MPTLPCPSRRPDFSFTGFCMFGESANHMGHFAWAFSHSSYQRFFA
ncbi:hypothetical protein Dxin01_00331 [Deinococcus xinjiangensis]|uniref:Uncharacterized protein n=1 Tax=Deinococcus xinjiangensis TaxID=457454 RepID=A0ABP9V5V8_9DEIO